MYPRVLHTLIIIMGENICRTIIKEQYENLFKCNETKELTEFYYRNDTKSYRNECKLCNKLTNIKRLNKDGARELKNLKEKERRKNHKLEINKRLHELRSTPESKARISQNAKNAKNNNPERYRAISLRGRYNYITRKHSVINSPKKDITNWIKSMPKVCEYCFKDCSSNYHIDHIEPISKGGSNTIDNLAISCPSCNHSKFNHQLIIWLIIRNNRSKR